MDRYFATFVAGTKNIVLDIMQQKLSGLKVEDCLDNLVVFKTDTNINANSELPWFNNFFQLVSKFGSAEMQSFDKIVDWAMNRPTFVDQVTAFAKAHKFSRYRIYFFQDHRSVEQRHNLDALKELISDYVGLEYSAPQSQFEIWIIQRREGVSLVGIRLSQKSDYQSELEPGELRHELAYILCHTAEPKPQDVVLDPFCGHGSIPITISQHFEAKRVLAADLDMSKINRKLTNRRLHLPNLELITGDGSRLDYLGDESVDKIITDPPWGLSTTTENIPELYGQMLKNFYRVLRTSGKIVLLTTQVQLVEELLDQLKFQIQDKFDLNVGGRVGTMFLLVK